jgi:hypothetical protein
MVEIYSLGSGGHLSALNNKIEKDGETGKGTYCGGNIFLWVWRAIPISDRKA